MPLTDGNFVVGYPGYYPNSSGLDSKGAALWMSGSTRRIGQVSESELLVGANYRNQMGPGGIVDLGSGRYAVVSPGWNGRRGAVTWCQTGNLVSGVAGSANSLTGPTGNDRVGSGGVKLLNDGNAVVSSPNWAGLFTREGAVTRASGVGGLMATVTAANSLTGGRASALAGSGGVTFLGQGCYVVASPAWAGFGAVTWMNGATAGQGIIHEGNSITGSAASDRVGSGGITRLANGNYVILSTDWSGTKGAITWADGYRRSVFKVSAGNSLVGSTAGDFFGTLNSLSYPSAVAALRNGHYVVTSSAWDPGTVVNAGAITWGNGHGGSVGPLPASNSLTGRINNDFVGYFGVFTEPDGAYAVDSRGVSDQGLPSVAAVTFSSGGGPLIGTPDSSNIVIGGLTNGGIQLLVDYHAPRHEWAVGLPRESRVTLFSYAEPVVPVIGLEMEGGLDLTSAAAVDFGEVAKGASAEKTISIINRGGAALNPEPPVLVGAGFSVMAPLPLTTLPPGSRTSLTLRFTASTPGPATAAVSLGSNAPGNSLFTLNLRGSGLPVPGLPFGITNAPPVLTALPSGGTQVAFQAIPGRTYLLQRSFDLLTWPYVRQVMADGSGTILFTDTDPQSMQAFYRIKED